MLHYFIKSAGLWKVLQSSQKINQKQKRSHEAKNLTNSEKFHWETSEILINKFTKTLFKQKYKNLIQIINSINIAKKLTTKKQIQKLKYQITIKSNEKKN